ncbi:MAG TPA: hypothetical protein PKD78_03810 [Saprospiraceae bacterium]|nr:hypothetical protein [Saprospiraceae bacterium]
MLSKNSPSLFWLGTSTYALLAVLAAVFYMERTVFIDLAFHLFYLLKDGSFAIQNYRFGAFFTQMFPLLAAKAHLPLAQVMMCYSVGFVVYYAAIFLLCLRLSRPHALLLLLYQVWMVTDTFYWTQSEFSQGVALCILWWAAVGHYERQERMPVWVTGLSPVVLLLVAFFHPLMAVVFLYMAAYQGLHPGLAPQRRLVASGVVSFVGMLVLKTRFFKTQYDADASERLGHLFQLKQYWGTPVWGQFFSLLWSHFYLLALGLAVAAVALVRERAWGRLALMLFSLLGYLLVVNPPYPEGAEDFYLENLYLPLSLMVLLPLVLDVLPALPARWSTAAVAVALALRLAHIGWQHAPYTARLDWERQWLRRNATEDKLIFADAVAPMDTMLMTWGTGYEFWLLSTVEEGRTRSVLIDDSPRQFGWAMNDSRLFLTKWGAFPYEKLPQRYFIFRDTVRRYELR